MPNSNQKIKLEIKKYPKMIEAFASENFNLKTLLGLLLLLLFLNSVVTGFLLKRGPEVIALDAGGQVARKETKVTDLQISEAIKEYISYRYTWTNSNAKDQIKRAEFFVEPILLVSFRKSMIEVLKFIQEKKVSERVYLKSIDVDLTGKTASLTLDRITEFDQLKAATEMKLILDFIVQDRTPVNPWGVYVTKETEKVAD